MREIFRKIFLTHGVDAVVNREMGAMILLTLAIAVGVFALLER